MKNFRIDIIQRRVASKCHPFFILFAVVFFISQDLRAEFSITNSLSEAYHNILRLQISNGRSILQREQQRDKNNSLILLIENYADVLQILISDDKKLYDQLKGNESKRLDLIKKDQTQSPWKLLAEAEIRFQWAIVKVKFQDELYAAWQFRQVYQLLAENKKKYPDFLENKKLAGLLQIFIGSVPEKYEKVVKALGFKGSVPVGLNYLKQVEYSNSVFALEAAMLRAAAEKYIVKKSECISCRLEPYLEREKDNLLLQYLASAILVKEGNSDEALKLIKDFPFSNHEEFPLVNLLAGEIFLFQGQYIEARNYFFQFLKQNKGKNHIKDANFKIFLTYWLQNQDKESLVWLNRIKNEGSVVYDSDKYAARFAEENPLPDKILMKARLATDGGYLDLALKELSKYCIKKEINHRDNLEFWYRKGRISQLKGNYPDAKLNYHRLISLSEGKNYYFAPNACLQLGYIYREEGDKKSAKAYFLKALKYADHEYKNSIDNKAKAAIGELDAK